MFGERVEISAIGLSIDFSETTEVVESEYKVVISSSCFLSTFSLGTLDSTYASLLLFAEVEVSSDDP